MAIRRSVHQPSDSKGSLVAASRIYEMPLLPFEKQLISILGCSEQEYRWFAAEAQKKSQLRPVEYAHIPDIQNGPVAVAVVSIAVGIAATAASYILSPKPNLSTNIKPKEVSSARDQSVVQQQLDNVVGATRFTPTFGFDTTAELANYGSPIPIIFGLYNDIDQVGGVLATPKLVWSRMFSYGTHQAVKLMFVVGEQGKADQLAPDGIIEPDLSGIFLGNNALNAVYDSNFAFYWKRNTTTSGLSRIRVENKFYGTNATPQSADPNQGWTAARDDVYLCPTASSNYSPGFCGAFTPANNTEFGCYSAIANGSIYRVNWQVISIPRLRDTLLADIDPGAVLRRERIKIAGDRNNQLGLGGVYPAGMPGTGRNYSCRMGIVRLNSTTVGVGSPQNGPYQLEVPFNEGDEILFLISDSKIPQDAYGDQVTVDDINSQVAALQRAADDALQVGEIFSIGSSLWQVIRRTKQRFEVDESGDQEITLRCIDVSHAFWRSIGIVSRSVVDAWNGIYINDGDTGQITPAGAGFYALTKFSAATVRNTTACEVTEFGIRSVVYQRLNGLANLMSIPSPAQLWKADNDRINISNGTITSYIARSSVFTIYVRRAGLDASGNEYVFQRIPVDFVVTGNQPVAQYHFIRIFHPLSSGPLEYEYKFVPRPAADVRNMSTDTKLVQLMAAASNQQGNISLLTAVPNYGEFKIQSTGRLVSRKFITKNQEFYSNVQTQNSLFIKDFPATVGIDTLLPDDQPETTSYVTGVKMVEYDRPADQTAGLISDPSNAKAGRIGAFTFDAFGDPDNDSLPSGWTKTFRTKEYVTGNRWVELEWTAQKETLPSGHYARNNGQTHNWTAGWVTRGLGIRVVRSSPGWDNLSRFAVRRGKDSTATNPNSGSTYSNSNPFAINHPQVGKMDMSGYVLEVDGVQSSVFVYGREQGYAYELFGRAQNRSVGSTASATINGTSSDGKSIQLVLSSEVYYDGNHWSGESHLWRAIRINVVNNELVTSRSWNTGDVFEHKVSVSASNPFAQHYKNQNKQIGIRYVIEAVNQIEITSSDISGDREFEGQSQINDLSFYRGFVEKSNDSEPEHSIVYVNEIVDNKITPLYSNLTTAGLVLRSSRAFTRLDQLRVWLGKGVPVLRLHPDKTTYESNTNSLSYNASDGPSNLFTDLVFYLLTNFQAGLGGTLYMSAANPNLIDVEKMQETSKFLYTNKLFCNGAIDQKVNAREFIGANAPNFLCMFVISDGKFSLQPALPVNSNGSISVNPVTIKQIFTSGNILEDSFELEYLEAEERQRFTASLRFREERKNKLPQERTITLRFADGDDGLDAVETFDLTQFVTSQHHAEMVGRYFLSIRKLVTHNVKFQTTLSGLNLAPGDLIKVITEVSPYSAARNGVVDASGNITSATSISDGQYDVLYYPINSEDVLRATMPVSNGTVTDSKFYSSVFTIYETSSSRSVYMVEQLSVTEDGLVEVVASEYPCDSNDVSELAKLVTTPAAFTNVEFG